MPKMLWVLLGAFILCTIYSYMELHKLAVIVASQPLASMSTPSPAPAPSVQPTLPNSNTKAPDIGVGSNAPVVAPYETDALARLDRATRLQLGWTRFWQGEVLLFLLCLAVGAAFYIANGRIWYLSDEKASTKNMQLVLVVTGFLGAAAHAFWTERKDGSSYAPNFDAVSIGWLAIALVGFLLPKLQEFGFAGASFKLRDTVNSIGDLVEESTDLLQNWTGAINLLAAWLVNEPRESPARILGFIRDRAGEAAAWLQAPDEKLRLSVWAVDPSGLQILYPQSIDNQPVQATSWKPGEGLLGRSYLEQRIWNEKNAKSLPAYVAIPNEYQDYNGILLVPITYEDRRLGMLCITREKEANFSGEQENVACALARILAFAMGSSDAVAALKIAAGASKTVGIGRE